ATGGDLDLRFRGTAPGDPDLRAQPPVTGRSAAGPVGDACVVTSRFVESYLGRYGLNHEELLRFAGTELTVVFVRARSDGFQREAVKLRVAAVIPAELCGDPDHDAFLSAVAVRQVELW